MPSELGGYESDRPNRHETGGLELTPAQREARAEASLTAWDECREQERAKSWEAAEARGLTREQWRMYEDVGQEDTYQAGQLEEARSALRRGPPEWRGTTPTTDEQKLAHRERYEQQQAEALEYFRTEPVEGAENRPFDPERRRPSIGWRDADPPIPPGDLSKRDAVIYVRENRRDWQDPRTGLGGHDAAPNAQLNPEQRAEKIEEAKQRSRDVMAIPEGRGWSNSRYAGKPYDKLPEPLQEQFPSGVEFSDEGFPQFDRYGCRTVVFVEGFRGPGLMDEDLHGTVGHYGGVRVAKAMGLWEGDR